MIPTFIKLLEIKIVESNNLFLSKMLRILASFGLSEFFKTSSSGAPKEKKAISDPETIADKNSNTNTAKIAASTSELMSCFSMLSK